MWNVGWCSTYFCDFLHWFCKHENIRTTKRSSKLNKILNSWNSGNFNYSSVLIIISNILHVFIELCNNGWLKISPARQSPSSMNPCAAVTWSRLSFYKLEVILQSWYYLWQVQIRPWNLNDSDFVMDGSQPLDPRKTIFVGGVPRPLRAGILDFRVISLF